MSTAQSSHPYYQAQCYLSKINSKVKFRTHPHDDATQLSKVMRTRVRHRRCSYEVVLPSMACSGAAGATLAAVASHSST